MVDLMSHVVPFTGFNLGALKGRWHPNAEGHRVMAEHMADDIMGYIAPEE